MAPLSKIGRTRALVFFGVTTLAGTAAVLIAANALKLEAAGAAARATAVMLSLVPGLAALVTCAAMRLNAGEVLGLRRPPKQTLLIAWLGPYLVVGLAWLMQGLWGGSLDLSRDALLQRQSAWLNDADQLAQLAKAYKEHRLHPLTAYLMGSLVAAWVPNILLVLGAELGFRGLVLGVGVDAHNPQQEPSRISQASWCLASGAFWATWQLSFAPLLFAATPPPERLLWEWFWSAELGFVLALVRWHCGSILPALLARGAFVALAPLPYWLGQQPMHSGFTGIASPAIMLALGVLAFLAWVWHPARRYEHDHRPRGS